MLIKHGNKKYREKSYKPFPRMPITEEVRFVR